jgi:hypothetical protein
MAGPVERLLLRSLLCEQNARPGSARVLAAHHLAVDRVLGASFMSRARVVRDMVARQFVRAVR